MPLAGQYVAHSRKRRGNEHRKMNGAHRESHDAACPLLPRRRRLRPAHPLQTACFPKPRLFIFTLFSRCLFSLLRSGLPFFLRSLFLSRASPRSTLSARESGVLFPARSKTPLRSLLRPGCSFSFLLNPGLSVVISYPFSFCLSPLALPPFASMPSCPSSLFLFTLPSPAHASAFLLNPGRLLSPPSSPWPFPPVLFFSPILSLTPEKSSKKSPSLTEKTSCLRLFPIRPIKKPSQREL